MTEQILTREQLTLFCTFLHEAECSKETIKKYMRDVHRFYDFLGEDKVYNKENIISYKQYLKEHYKPSSANSMLAALNRMFDWMGVAELKVKGFKNQRQIFCQSEKYLSIEEYTRIVEAAKKQGDERLALILQTICGTGIRVSELVYITVEAVQNGRAVVSGKGKNRTIFISKKLQKYLQNYCRKRKIKKGSIFITSSGKPIDRSNIWSAMKGLCEAAKVLKEKVFPHNLRHLFARTCYRQSKDIVYLADILGHSSVETTRIYTISSGLEHEQMIERMRLIL